MNAMQFRTYQFAHNPQSISIHAGERLASHFCPGRGELVQSLGGEARRITCKGTFFGGGYSEALAQLMAFRAAAGDGKAGLLFIPGLAPLTAYLKELAFEAQGDGRMIPYTMLFVEERA